MALFKSLKSIGRLTSSIFKKSKEKLAASTKRRQAGPPASQRGEPQSKGLGGKTVKVPFKKTHFKDVYKILKEPHISEKATVLVDENKYIFKVYPTANKVEIKKAIERLYGVRVKDVNIINVHRKKRIVRGLEGFKTGYKKAIVTLEEGQKIEILTH